MDQDTIVTKDSAVDIVWCLDTNGALIGIPAPVVRRALARGRTTLSIGEVSLVPDELPEQWLTVTEAAKLHVEGGDVDGDTLETAKVRVCRACKAGKIVSRGNGLERRIEPQSLAAWRLEQRERNLDRDQNL